MAYLGAGDVDQLAYSNRRFRSQILNLSVLNRQQLAHSEAAREEAAVEIVTQIKAETVLGP